MSRLLVQFVSVHAQRRVPTYSRHNIAKTGWKVVGEVKKVGKSRNFQPKVEKIDL